MRIATITAALLMPAISAAGSFTLEQVLSAPIPNHLAASRGGAKLAWVLSERGVRNVWIAAAPNYKGARATHYTEDDGQDIGEIQWLGDSSGLIYTRGGDLEFAGLPDPNPASNPAGVEQDIWLLHPGQAPRKIAPGHSPRFRRRETASPLFAMARCGRHRSAAILRRSN